MNSYAYQLIATIQSCIIFGYGGYLVINKSITFGVFMVFVTYIEKLFTPFIRLSRMSAQLKMLRISIERIMNILEFEDEKIDNYDTEKIDSKQFLSNIKFDNISFSYDDKTTCIQRATVAYVLYKYAHVNVEFYSGVRTKPYIMHCWLERHDVVIFDSPMDSRGFRYKKIRLD